jgi:hypothetical protein
MLRIIPYGKNPAVNLWVQRLHPHIEAFREAGEILDLRDRDAGPLDRLRGGTRWR